MPSIDSRSILVGLLTVGWVGLSAHHVYLAIADSIPSERALDIPIVIINVLGIVLIVLRNKWADLGAIGLFGFLLIRAISIVVLDCQSRNVSSVRQCLQVLAVYWHWWEFTFVALCMIAVVFLVIDLFRKPNAGYR
jgi:hypothetical protein